MSWHDAQENPAGGQGSKGNVQCCSCEPGTSLAPSDDQVPSMELRLAKRKHGVIRLIVDKHGWLELR